jgi:hypothetical protein
MKKHEYFTHRLHSLRNDIIEEINYELEKIGVTPNQTIFLTDPIVWNRVGSEVDYIDRIMKNDMVMVVDFENFSYPLKWNFLKPSVLINILEELEEKRFFIQ